MSITSVPTHHTDQQALDDTLELRVEFLQRGLKADTFTGLDLAVYVGLAPDQSDFSCDFVLDFLAVVTPLMMVAMLVLSRWMSGGKMKRVIVEIDAM